MNKLPPKRQTKTPTPKKQYVFLGTFPYICKDIEQVWSFSPTLTIVVPLFAVGRGRQWMEEDKGAQDEESRQREGSRNL